MEQTINPSLILGSIQSFKKAGCKEFRCGPLFMLCCFSFSDGDCCQSPVIVCWLMGGGGIILCTCVPVWLCSFHLSVIRFRSWPITLREALLQVLVSPRQLPPQRYVHAPVCTTFIDMLPSLQTSIPFSVNMQDRTSPGLLTKPILWKSCIILYKPPIASL